MEELASALRMTHIACGFVGLAAFWIPIFAKKGGRAHIVAGRVFEWCAYVVSVSALASCAWIIADPAFFLRTTEAPPAAIAGTRAFAALLGSLALVTFSSTRFGVRVVRTRERPAALRSPFQVGVSLATILGGLAVFAIGLALDSRLRPLLLTLSAIGPLVGWGQLHYMRDPQPARMAWWYEHMGSMLGSGIAFHTAFLAFGMNRLLGLQPTGMLGILPWVLPTAIGIPAAHVWIAYYRRRFGDDGKMSVSSPTPPGAPSAP